MSHSVQVHQAQVAGPAARLLVVDDDESMRLLLAKILEGDGWRVACAAGGAEAIEVLRGTAPDLVVLDLLMPRPSGWDVLAFMDESPPLAAVPVVVLTAFGEGETARPRRPMIHKPVESDLLLRLVHELTEPARVQEHVQE